MLYLTTDAVFYIIGKRILLKKTVQLAEFTVAVPKGAFPVLNTPQFIGAEKRRKVYFRHEPVISLSFDGQARPYPLNVLTHEIANDTLAGISVLVIYCPFCNVSAVYDRRLNHKGKEWLLTFGVSGMLRNRDMVKYDLQTETWWQQLKGNALVGNLAGAELKVISSLVISVEQLFQR